MTDAEPDTTITMQEFNRREQARADEFNAGMAAVRARTSPIDGNEVKRRSDAQRRANLRALSRDDLAELVMTPCERCRQRRHDLFKLADRLSSKLVWEVTLDDFKTPFTPTEEFLDEAGDTLHDALAATLDAHGYDYSTLLYVIEVE